MKPKAGTYCILVTAGYYESHVPYQVYHNQKITGKELVFDNYTYENNQIWSDQEVLVLGKDKQDCVAKFKGYMNKIEEDRDLVEELIDNNVLDWILNAEL